MRYMQWAGQLKKEWNKTIQEKHEKEGRGGWEQKNTKTRKEGQRIETDGCVVIK